MSNIFLVDFDDSFTFNIASELKEMGLSSQVIHWQKFLDQVLLDAKQKQVLIIGPGPGHPEEYRAFSDYLKTLMNRSGLLMVGICLGHQLLWQAQGVSVEQSAHPVHGQAVDFKIPSWFDFFPEHLREKKIKVQRYNSLFVPYDEEKAAKLSAQIAIQSGQVMASRFANCLSFQFHPESVGTSYRSCFFKPIKEFLV